MQRAFAVLLVVGLALSAAAPTAGAADTESCVGPVERPADGETFVATRGFRPTGGTIEKRPAFLVAVDRRAAPARSRNLADRDRFVGRSVSVSEAGVLLVTREGNHSVVELLDAAFRPTWTARFGVDGGPRATVDAHAALLDPDGVVVAADDRLVRYDPASDRVDRTWPLPDDAVAEPERRVTDVAAAEEGYLVTVAGNGTGSLLAVRDDGVAWRVDGLAEPAAVQSLGGTALVAETAADRVVELDRSGETVWALAGLHRPESVRRLPGGATLVADGGTHRVLTVSPRGRVLWTTYVPWEPADVDRAVSGDPPTAAAIGVEGRHHVDGENATLEELAACRAGLASLDTNRSERARTVADDGAPLGAVAALALGAVVLALAARRQIGRASCRERV